MSSSSSSDDRSHYGGAKLVPQPRRQPSKAQIPPPAPAKESTHRKLQAQGQVIDPDSPTPLPRSQRTAERTAAQPFAVQPVPYLYQGMGMQPMMGFPPFMPRPGYGRIPSESSSSSGFIQVPMPSIPTGYPNNMTQQTARQMILASQPSQTGGSIDAITTGLGGIKLKGYQEEANKYIRHVQQQIFTIVQRTGDTEGLPTQYFNNLNIALKQLTGDLGHLSGFIDRIAMAADEAKNKDNKSDAFQATAGTQALEIARLNGYLEEARLALSRSEKHNEEIHQTYQNMIQSLREQYERAQQDLTECKEIIEGKRHLFYTSHNDVEAKARILSIVADNDYREKAKIIQSLIDSNLPDKGKILEILFSNNAQAPAHNRSVSYQVPPSMMAIQSGAATPAGDTNWSVRRPSRVTPPAPSMRRTPSSFQQGSLVRGGPPASMPPNRYSQPRAGPPGSTRPAGHHAGPNAARYKFEDTDDSSAGYGSPPASEARQMIVSQAQMEWTQQIERWKEEFSKAWRLAHGWAQRHAIIVVPDQDQTIQAEAPRLWEFMCDILYPGQPEAGASHARFLLEDQQCRPYFVERMMLQYIVNNILSVEGWMGFSDETDRELRELQARLLRTEVFKSYIRQTISDQINNCLARMLAHPDFPAYRARRINYHQARLKTIVGPLMDATASRTDAGFDLHAVASTALQCSALMFQSRLNFEFTWSHTCSKFSVEFHVPKEPPADPMMLQSRQYRLKLVVTPAIVFRDDRGVSSAVKRVLRSEVFVMN